MCHKGGCEGGDLDLWSHDVVSYYAHALLMGAFNLDPASLFLPLWKSRLQTDYGILIHPL